jgi:hypothetical protein
LRRIECILAQWAAFEFTGWAGLACKHMEHGVTEYSAYLCSRLALTHGTVY